MSVAIVLQLSQRFKCSFQSGYSQVREGDKPLDHNTLHKVSLNLPHYTCAADLLFHSFTGKSKSSPKIPTNLSETGKDQLSAIAEIPI